MIMFHVVIFFVLVYCDDSDIEAYVLNNFKIYIFDSTRSSWVTEYRYKSFYFKLKTLIEFFKFNINRFRVTNNTKKYFCMKNISVFK